MVDLPSPSFPSRMHHVFLRHPLLIWSLQQPIFRRPYGSASGGRSTGRDRGQALKRSRKRGKKGERGQAADEFWHALLGVVSAFGRRYNAPRSTLFSHGVFRINFSGGGDDMFRRPLINE